MLDKKQDTSLNSLDTPFLYLGRIEKPQPNSADLAKKKQGKIPKNTPKTEIKSLKLRFQDLTFEPIGSNEKERTNNDVIQQAWLKFGTMSDNQRNTLLKGLLAKCNSQQIEFICSDINLKLSVENEVLYVLTSRIN